MVKKITSKWFKSFLALSLTFSLFTVWASDGRTASAEGPLDPAPIINPVGTANGKKVLFDNTHGQTAGAADWVIDGAFSDFAQALATSGYYVKELRQSTPITFENLQQYDVFVIPEANNPYKSSEQAALLKYVQEGGSIFFISDHYNADRNKNRWDSSEVFNGYRRGAYENPAKGMSADEAGSVAMQNVSSSDWLSDNFGVRFRYNSIGNVTANNIVPKEQSFGITEGVQGVAMHAGSTLAVTNPAIAKGIVYLPQTTDKWPHAVDDGIYNGGGVAEGPYVAISKVTKGKAAFIGDSSPVEDITPKYLREENGQAKKTYDGFKEVDDAKLLVNVVNWLSHDEAYTNFTQVPGLQLDQPTALHSYEIPQQSTEPKPEPWAVPATGYKWWDQSSFKPGSFGYTGSTNPGPGPGPGPVTPAYTLEYPASIKAGQPFSVCVKVSKAAPNTTLDLQLGIYVTGGQQIGQIQNSDGTWPTTYGYQAVSLQTDGLGNGCKTITVRTEPSKTGAATIRLRSGKSNVVTNSITITPN
ncbi:DNA-binding protein [Paenibacillus sp. SC116]|uniref:DNA-binding protein n=1 Tax=Paenibacillus sp. SC116 TaxID=2968986 RepID=UPI0035C6F75E